MQVWLHFFSPVKCTFMWLPELMDSEGRDNEKANMGHLGQVLVVQAQGRSLPGFPGVFYFIQELSGLGEQIGIWGKSIVLEETQAHTGKLRQAGAMAVVGPLHLRNLPQWLAKVSPCRVLVRLRTFLMNILAHFISPFLAQIFWVNSPLPEAPRPLQLSAVFQ